MTAPVGLDEVAAPEATATSTPEALAQANAQRRADRAATRRARNALRNTEWAQTQERSNAFALRLMAWIALTCGRRVARWVLHPITLYFLLFAPTPRRHSARFLARALGRPAAWRDRYRHIHTFASTVLDRVYMLSGRMDLFEMEALGEALVFKTIDEGRGAFMLGAHFGSFETVRSVGRAYPNLRMAMIMYPDNARLINQTLAAIAPDDKQAEIIALGRVDSTLVVRDWLDEGGLAGMLADRSLPGESQRGGSVTVPFLGVDASFSDGPFRLATLLRRRVFSMVGLYLGGNRYEVRFQELANFRELAASPEEREQRITDAVVAYAAWLEALCREQPYNWFNFFDFWHEDPT